MERPLKPAGVVPAVPWLRYWTRDFTKPTTEGLEVGSVIEVSVMASSILVSLPRGGCGTRGHVVGLRDPLISDIRRKHISLS